MPLKNDDSGIEHLIGIIVAIGIFLLAFAIISSAAKTSIYRETGKTDLYCKANQAITLAASSPGIPAYWEQNPDAGGTKIQRFGLADETNPYALSSKKFINMADALLDADPDNGKLDYEEAKFALGLQGYNFHLRAYPIFEDEASTGYGTLWLDDVNVAYVGNYDGSTEMEESMSESATVSALCVEFANSTYPSGDKFPDTSSLETSLVQTLDSDYYKILVVGSKVGQTALTPAAIKGAIERWVKRGGNLVVLGGEQNANWLEPFLTTGTRGASGGTYVPDKGHPVLNTPNHLSYDCYTDPERAWILPNETYSHIITYGPAPGQKGYMKDALAISNRGVINDKNETIFGNGTVILTTYLAYNLSEYLGLSEECRFTANLFVYGAHRNMFLDYGPPIPSGACVAYSERLPVVNYLNYGLVEMRMVIYVWK
ncbi:MAG: hypothetical protein PHH26_06135 [Candidatus Thermoplasmatota archaeon]|nr:hypothetical protein [Candidatus Thermoplasmatota archaeon]